jgi:hypothetical protein
MLQESGPFVSGRFRMLLKEAPRSKEKKTPPLICPGLPWMTLIALMTIDLIKSALSASSAVRFF